MMGLGGRAPQDVLLRPAAGQYVGSMQLRQLEYLVALARERHFARAAAACHVSQPALSASLARLEQELGVALINRGHSFAGLTAEGELLLAWARRVVAERDSLRAELGARRHGVSGTLALGAGPSAATTVALPVQAFCAANPLARVRTVTGVPGSELARRLREFELDAAVAVFDSHDLSELIVHHLYEERYVLIACAELVEPRTTTITWRQAAALPLALLSPEMRSREILDEAFSRNGVNVQAQFETDSFAGLFAAVRTRRWAGVVPHARAQALLDSGPVRAIRSIPLVEPAITAQVSVAINAARPGSAIAQAFMSAAATLTDEDWEAWATDPVGPTAG